MFEGLQEEQLPAAIEALLFVTDGPELAPALAEAVKPLPHRWTLRELPLDLEGTVIL